MSGSEVGVSLSSYKPVPSLILTNPSRSHRLRKSTNRRRPSRIRLAWTLPLINVPTTSGPCPFFSDLKHPRSHSPLTWSRVRSTRCGRSGEFRFIYPDDILRFGGPISQRMIQRVHQAVAAEPQPPTKGTRMKTTISICKWAVKTCYCWHFVGNVQDRKYYEIIYQFVPSSKFQITVRWPAVETRM